MKKTRFTKQQIAFALNQAVTGKSVNGLDSATSNFMTFISFISLRFFGKMRYPQFAFIAKPK